MTKKAHNSKMQEAQKKFDAERKNLQATISKNQNQIKTLQSNLEKAQNEAKKIATEKANYEKKVKGDLDNVTKAKSKAESELAKAKADFESKKKNLDSSINSLKAEIAKKESEKSSLAKQVSDKEKAMKSAESQAKQSQNSLKKQYDAKVNNLNKQIQQKTQQLQKKTNELRNLSNEYNAVKSKVGSSEASTFVDLEIAKGESRKLKTELKILVAKAKEIEAENEQELEQMKKEFEATQQDFVEQIKGSQEAELQNLMKIEELNNLVQELKAKNIELTRAGKLLEQRYSAKIKSLETQLATAKAQYEEIIKSYEKAESQNLLTIDSLKQQLNEALAKNKALSKMAQGMQEAKIAEDIADSELEVKTLMKIENLTNELNQAIMKNRGLIESMKKLRIAQDISRDRKKITELADNYDRYRWSRDNLYSKVENVQLNVRKNGQRNRDRKVFNRTKNAEQGNSDSVEHHGKPRTKNYDDVNSQRGVINKKVRGRHPIDIMQYQSQSEQETVSTDPDPIGDSAEVEENASVYQDSNRSENTNGTNANHPTPKNVSIEPSQDQDNYDVEHQNETSPVVTNESFSQSKAQRLPYIEDDNMEQISKSNVQVVPNRQNIVSTSRDTQRKSDTKNAGTANDNGSSGKEIIGNLKRIQNRPIENETELVDFAIDSILKSLQKMTGYDVEKTNISMNLIGADPELAKKLNAVMEVLKEQFDPRILKKAFEEIAKRYNQRLDFVNESLAHLYGADGKDLVLWSDVAN